jgi:hypothetical protein
MHVQQRNRRLVVILIGALALLYTVAILGVIVLN